MCAACGSTAFKASDAYARELSRLATCQAVLLHCASCVRSEAAKRITATQLGGIFRDLLKQRSYMPVQLTHDHAREFSKAIEGCKASQYFPPVCFVACFCLFELILCPSCIASAWDYKLIGRSIAEVIRSKVQGFQRSALALLLVAARVCLEGKLFSELLKDAAVSTGFCRQLQEIAAENMAVLTGKQPPTFTERTNSCMWYVRSCNLNCI